jgi:hypothetical protein
MPVGPLGQHLKIKEAYQDWKVPVENAIGECFYDGRDRTGSPAHSRVPPAAAGGRMDNFIVTSHEDRQTLQEMGRRIGLTNQLTIVTQKRHARYNVRPDPQGVLTVYSCLQVRGLFGDSSLVLCTDFQSASWCAD